MRIPSNCAKIAPPRLPAVPIIPVTRQVTPKAEVSEGAKPAAAPTGATHATASSDHMRAFAGATPPRMNQSEIAPPEMLPKSLHRNPTADGGVAQAKMPYALHVIGQPEQVEVPDRIGGKARGPDPKRCDAAALRATALLRLDVPREMFVAGFDNLRFNGAPGGALTTVDQPKQEMGPRAVELLLERLEFDLSPEPRIDVFRQHPVIRESCAVARAAISSRLEFANRERA
ncbi:MAG: substrate-binding domain-containing protein [Bryobacteraceae bacterium]